MADTSEQSSNWRVINHPAGHQRSRCSLLNSPTPQSGQGSADLPPDSASNWQRLMAWLAGCQQDGPSSASSMPSDRATQPAPACLT
eukprot:2932281-Alexandrium_andersonii.AAC.1